MSAGEPTRSFNNGTPGFHPASTSSNRVPVLIAIAFPDRLSWTAPGAARRAEPPFVSNQAHFFSPALRGVRANLVPGLVLQACALVLVVGYFELPALRNLLATVGELKVEYGYLYAALSTSFFVGVVPYVVILLGGRRDRQRPLHEAAFFVFYWMIRGLEVDLFYRLQASWFGEDSSVTVIATKVVVDQFIYNPLWACPSQMLAFLWKDSGYSLERTRESLRRQSLVRRTALILVTTWSVWVPAVAIIYTLPTPLQLPLCNLVGCFWCLLLTFISKDTTQSGAAEVVLDPALRVGREL